MSVCLKRHFGDGQTVHWHTHTYCSYHHYLSPLNLFNEKGLNKWFVLLSLTEVFLSLNEVYYFGPHYQGTTSPCQTTCTKVTNMPPSTRRSQRSTRRLSPSESMDENEVSLKLDYRQRCRFRFLEVCFSFLNATCHCDSWKNETVQRLQSQPYLFLSSISIWDVLYLFQSFSFTKFQFLSCTADPIIFWWPGIEKPKKAFPDCMYQYFTHSHLSLL